ncbi:MAG: dihydrolipoyl dehydrogenase [Candidatus Accumulibacter phosphatis]|jgi:dihydrolipoamide dehydrogenase|uniref:Dihydrolipoyl dehydrogenase n=1 Tax=Candidatus Accumulibacter contiguus TaxID=2954381 RepID=A0ABX1T5W1_9PROT|nr:dihydrolipoyl dehydrogenase [Candidatus Accumulibacter contiguus]NMQ04498.1 dihydrolipoyl dehydrogenase [Candidatus Accumulibacter contiguus]
MNTLEVDVAIIGAGTAGMSAYRAALAHTRSVLVIEGGPYGTTCARVGCMPSKLLIAAAEAAHAARHADAFGVVVDSLRIDGAAVMQRVRDERDRFVGFVTEAVEHWPAEHRLRGHARFLDGHTLQVGEHTRVTARRIVIASGSHPNVPAEWREAAGDRLIVNDDVFAWQSLPQSVAVLGTGVIALELAQALHRLGVRVGLYGRSERVGPLTDPVLQSATRKVFAQELPMRLGASDLHLQRVGNEVAVRVGDEDAAAEQRYEWILAASGRPPNLQALGLQQSGLPLDTRGVPLFDPGTGQIADSHVFIAGDATHEREILHEAADEGRIAGDNAGRFPDVRVRPRRAPLSVVFSDPQIMLAGQSHAQLLHSGLDFAVGGVSFEDQGRSRVMLKNRGALHLYAERRSGRLLGAEMLGPAAEHLGHLLAWSVQRGDSVQAMLDSPFYHPVIEEGLRTALRGLQRALRMGPPPVERCLDCGPGA